jgi:hypothetical protein
MRARTLVRRAGQVNSRNACRATGLMQQRQWRTRSPHAESAVSYYVARLNTDGALKAGRPPPRDVAESWHRSAGKPNKSAVERKFVSSTVMEAFLLGSTSLPAKCSRNLENVRVAKDASAEPLPVLRGGYRCTSRNPGRVHRRAARRDTTGARNSRPSPAGRRTTRRRTGRPPRYFDSPQARLTRLGACLEAAPTASSVSPAGLVRPTAPLFV